VVTDWKVGVAAAACAAATGAIAPVIGLGVLALVALPALTTAGCLSEWLDLRRVGGRLPPRYRAAVGPLATSWWIRATVAVSSFAVAPAVAVAGAVPTALILDRLFASPASGDLVLRLGGAGAALLLCASYLGSAAGTRAAATVDRVGRRAGPIIWMAAALLLIVMGALAPDVYPLPR
jgi:hypothetical protein